MDKCYFCGSEINPTEHHKIRRTFGGVSNPENILKPVCRKCHDLLEKTVDKGTRCMLRHMSMESEILVGNRQLSITTGSCITGSPIMLPPSSVVIAGDFLNKETGLKENILAYKESDNMIIASGSPVGWITYSLLHE